MTRWIVAATALLGLGAYAAQDEDLIKVTMEGRAPGKDRAARNEAILTAEREIILEVIEGILPKPDLVALKTILERAPRYIVPSPTLMKQDIEHDSVRVEIEAQVRSEMLRRDIAQCLLPHLLPPRKALALIAEQPRADAALSAAKGGPAETAVCEALHEIGLDTVDSAEVRSVYAGADLLPRIQGGAEGLAQLGRENLADIIIAGTATMRHEPPPAGSNVIACHAVISISIVRASDGKTVESKAVEAIVNGQDASEGDAQALEDACAKLKKEIGVPAVLAAAGASPPEDIVVSLVDPASDELGKALAETLRAAPGVENAEILLQTPKVLRLRVHYGGAMETLVDQISSRLCAGVRLGPKRVVGRLMELEVTGRQP